jgi:hypothetical protein
MARMGAVRMCARSCLAQRWRQVVVLAIVVGVVGTVVFAALAGARRTASSFDRFAASTRAYDVLVFFRQLGPSTVSDVQALPGVEAAALVDAPAVQLADGTFLAAGAPTDDVVFRDIARTRIVAGRDTAPGASDEIVIGEPLADRNQIEVGDSIGLVTFTPAQIQALVGEVGTPIPEPAGPRIRMKVVGISRSPVDLSQQGEAGGILLLPRAFVEKYGDQVGSYIQVVLVRLNDGSDGVPQFVRDLRRSVGDDPATVLDEIEPTSVSTSGVRESIDVLAIGLTVFAFIAGISGLVVIGLSAARVIALTAEARETWMALGLTRVQRSIALAVSPGGAVVVGTALAVVGAWLASPLMPMGLARRAEPAPGFDFDPLVLAVGGGAVAVALVAMVLVIAWRHAHPVRTPVTRRPSLPGRTLENINLAPSLGIGMRAAVEPRHGSDAFPTRSALIAATVAVVGVVAVSTFGPSVDRLARTPMLFGTGWDIAVDDNRAVRPEPDRPCSGLRSTRIARQPGLDDVAAICNLSVEIDGHPVYALGYMSMRGTIMPTVLDGRAPRAASEIGLGTDTLDTIHKQIGDRVRMQGPGGTAQFRIVARVVIPSLGDAQAVADGAILTGAGLDRVDEPSAQLSHAWVVATTANHAEPRAIERSLARLPDVGDPETTGIERPRLPLEVRRLQQVDNLPYFLAGFLALLGATAIGYTLATSVRRRRSELAVLKTLGFTRRQLGATIAWQATTVACIGIVLGVPLGIIAGRLTWQTITDSAGVAYSPEVSITFIVGAALAALLFTNAAAGLAGRAAAHVSPTIALRAE